MLTDRAVILAKLETAVDGPYTSANDPDPTASLNAILCTAPQITVNSEQVDRDIVSYTLGDLGFVPGIRSGTITFSTELRGKSAATFDASTNALRDDPLWQACGMAPTYASNSSSVIYRPTSTNIKSSALYAYLDGILHIFRGARGNMEIVLEDGQFGRLNWTLSGAMLAIPTGAGTIKTHSILDAALPSPTYDSFATKPPPFLAAGVGITPSGGSLNSDPIISSFNLNMNNDVQPRLDANQANGIRGFTLRRRRPAGSFNPEAVTKATANSDYFAYFANQTSLAITMLLGTVAGNRVAIDLPRMQIDAPQWVDRNGVRVFDVPYRATVNTSTGDDEVAVTIS